MEGSSKIAAAIIFGAVLIAGVLIFYNRKSEACRDWQARVQQLAPTYDSEREVIYHPVYEDRIVRIVPEIDGTAYAARVLASDRPANCPLP